MLIEVAKIMTRKPQANLRSTVPHLHPRDRCALFSTEVWRSWARQAFDDTEEVQTRDLGRKSSHRFTDYLSFDDQLLHGKAYSLQITFMYFLFIEITRSV